MSLRPEQKTNIIKVLDEASTKGITRKEYADIIAVPERTIYSWKRKRDKNIIVKKKGRKKPPPNKLKPKEEKEIVKVLLDSQWIDLSPREIYYKILDEKRKILASPATFYRIARKKSLLTKRVKSSPENPLNREIPRLVATGPNQVWSWDVSQIKSSARNVRFYLYVIVDIWSRLAIAWRLEENEESEKAIELWKTAIEGQSISGKNLTNHKDNGSIMRSTEMIKFVKDAGMIDSYSRAGVSDDNPYSESFFRTIKYFREFPDFFYNLIDGRKYFQNYFKEYNFTYRHSGIQFITPGERHYGEEDKIMDLRNEVVDGFQMKNSHRYSSKPKVFSPIIEVKIN